MRKQIDKTKWFKLICREWERNDLLLWVEGKAKANGKTLLKSQIWEVSEEFMTHLGISFKQEKNDEQFIKPKKVTDKNEPNIPVKPRGKGAPVKSTLTLKFVNDRVSALDKKVDAGFARLDKKIDTGLAKLGAKIDDRFDKLSAVVTELAGVVHEQGKSINKINNSIEMINNSIEMINNSINTINSTINTIMDRLT